MKEEMHMAAEKVVTLTAVRANVVLTFTEPLLGSAPVNREVYAKYIESCREKRVDALAELAGSEVETLPPVVDEAKGWTSFHKDETGIFLYDYAIKGFLKEAANVLKDGVGEKNLRSKFDNYVFVRPRRAHPTRDGKTILEPDGVLERPLRAMTPQGPRVTLARSDYLKAGCSLEFAVLVISGSPFRHPEELLESCLQYGSLKGLGQWRNGGYGSFDYTLEFA